MQYSPPKMTWGNFLLRVYGLSLIWSGKTPKTLAVLHNRQYRHLQIWQAISLVGTYIQLPAIPLLIFQKTGKPGVAAQALLVNCLPSVFLSPFGGKLTDRFGALRVFRVCQSVLLFQTTLLLIIQMLGYLEVWLLYTIIGINSMVLSANGPSFLKYLREQVGANQIQTAQTIASTCGTIIGAAGPLLAGIILSTGKTGATIIFGINSVSYIGLVVLLALRKPASNTTATLLPAQQLKEAVLEEKKQPGVLKYLVTMPVVGITLLVSTIIDLTTDSDQVILPVVGIANGGSTHIYTMLGWAILLGGLVGCLCQFRLKPGIGLLLGLSPLILLSFMGFALSPSLGWKMVGLGLMIATRQMHNISRVVVLHQTVDLKMAGRVFGIKQAMESLALIASCLLAGYITIPAFGAKAAVVGPCLVGLALLGLCALLTLFIYRRQQR